MTVIDAASRSRIESVRFAHVNLIAKDWKRLAIFYQDTFGLVPALPERHLSGPWLEEATGIKGVRIDGVHLVFPGEYGDRITLEIFQYNPPAVEQPKSVNRHGLGHIAFRVSDVQETLDAVIRNGGSPLGSVVSKEIEKAGTITFVYAQDPEGNIIELQNWH